MDFPFRCHCALVVQGCLLLVDGLYGVPAPVLAYGTNVAEAESPIISMRGWLAISLFSLIEFWVGFLSYVRKKVGLVRADGFLR